jgi:hypothetical protein
MWPFTLGHVTKIAFVDVKQLMGRWLSLGWLAWLRRLLMEAAGVLPDVGVHGCGMALNAAPPGFDVL